LGIDSSLNGGTLTMSNNKPADSPGRDSADWNGAWATICRLAAARQVALHEMKLDPLPIFETANINPVSDTLTQPTVAAMPVAANRESQRDRAIAEIEQASATLKAVEPALEPWQPGAVAAGEVFKPHSVWVFIGTTWLSIVLVMAGAIGAIGYFFG
jgi:hypothetical protein